MGIIDDLKRDEGFRSAPYKDTRGILTIGYGFNLDKGMTQQQAEALLVMGVEEVERSLRSLLSFWSSLSRPQQEVFINMAYNLGVNGLMKFKDTLASAERGDVDGVCSGLKDSQWYSQVGKRADRLIDQYREG